MNLSFTEYTSYVFGALFFIDIILVLMLLNEQTVRVKQTILTC